MLNACVISSDTTTDAHAQSLRLFGGLPNNLGNIYIALPTTSIAGTSMISFDSSSQPLTALPPAWDSIPKTTNGRVLQDSRLQKNAYWVWNKFSNLCKDLLPAGQRYVVQQDVEFEARCPAIDSTIWVQRRGKPLIACPFTIHDIWRRIDDLPEEKGLGLRGIPAALKQTGDSILVRLKGDTPLKCITHDAEGNPIPGFWFPCQFCNVTLIERSPTGEIRYHMTFYPAPISGSL